MKYILLNGSIFELAVKRDLILALSLYLSCLLLILGSHYNVECLLWHSSTKALNLEAI